MCGGGRGRESAGRRKRWCGWRLGRGVPLLPGPSAEAIGTRLGRPGVMVAGVLDRALAQGLAEASRGGAPQGGVSGQDSSPRSGSRIRRARGAADEHAPRHEHLRAEPYVSARGCAGVGRSGCAGSARSGKPAQAAEEPPRRSGAKKAAVKPVAEPEPAARGGQAGQAPPDRRRGGQGRGGGGGRAGRRGAAGEALELARPIEKREEPMLTASIEERARALFKDLPPMPAEEVGREEAAAGPAVKSGRCHGGVTAETPVAPPRPTIPLGPSGPAPDSHPHSRVRSSGPVGKCRGSSGPSRCSAPARLPEPGTRPAAGPRPGRSRVPAGRGPVALAARRPGPSTARAAPDLRARRREGRRPEEGQEGPEVLGRPGSGAGEHREDPRRDAPGHRQEGRPARLERLPGGAGPGQGGAGGGEDPDPGQRVHLGLRAGRPHEGARHPDRPAGVQGAGPDGDGEPAARLRPDRADRLGVRLPGGEGRGVRGPDRHARGRGGRRGAAGAAAAGGHDHGPRRPRQDVAAGLHPQGQRGRRRGGRHHPAHRRVPRHAAQRQEDHLPRHPGPPGVHRHAGPRARR